MLRNIINKHKNKQLQGFADRVRSDVLFTRRFLMVDTPKIKQCSIDHKNASEQGKVGDLFVIIVFIDFYAMVQYVFTNIKFS